MNNNKNNNDNKKTSLFVISSYFVFVLLCFWFFIVIFLLLFVSLSFLFFFFYRLCIKTCAVMIPLLGVTWLFGIFSTFHKAFAYIFTIFSSTQVNHCYVLRDTISELFK